MDIQQLPEQPPEQPPGQPPGDLTLPTPEEFGNLIAGFVQGQIPGDVDSARKLVMAIAIFEMIEAEQAERQSLSTGSSDDGDAGDISSNSSDSEIEDEQLLTRLCGYCGEQIIFGCPGNTPCLEASTESLDMTESQNLCTVHSELLSRLCGYCGEPIIFGCPNNTPCLEASTESSDETESQSLSTVPSEYGEPGDTSSTSSDSGYDLDSISDSVWPLSSFVEASSTSESDETEE